MLKEFHKPIQEGEPTQEVVRSLVVSLASPEEIYRQFQNQETPPSILRFYVGKKGRRETSEERYTLFGGKFDPRLENWGEATQREVTEEAGLRLLGIPYQTFIGKWKYFSPKSGERRVVLTYTPVLSCDQIIMGDPKIKEVAKLQLKELRQLITEGHLNGIPLEGHLTLGESEKDPVNMTPDDFKIKDASLNKALKWMEHIENYLRNRFEQVLKFGNGTISKEEFEKEYERIVSEYMRKGVEVAVKRKKEGEIEQHALIEVLDGGYLGKDILYYLPELAVHGIDWSGLDSATEGVRVFVGFLRKTFDDFLKKEELTSENFGQQMKHPNVLLEEKRARAENLDQFFRDRLKEIFGVNDEELNQVLGYIQNFFRDLSNEMKVADPNLTKGLYQDFTLVNEVNNANFGCLLSLFLGYDTKENPSNARTVIRFEAGRHLLLLLKGLAGIKYYQSEVEKIRNGRLQTAVNNFFGSLEGEETIDLPNGEKMRVRIRRVGDRNVIVDEKPIKTFTSFLRKSFEEKIEDIHDFYSVSVIFIDTKDANIADAERLIHDFQKFVSGQFPSFQLSAEDKQTYATENYLRNQNQQEVRGKRRGSQSSRLVRTKLILHLGEEGLEFVVYPFYSLSSSGNFWGWLEKIVDDQDYLVRRLLAGEHGIPSFYDLLFPPDLYPHHFSHKLMAEYHQ